MDDYYAEEDSGEYDYYDDGYGEYEDDYAEEYDEEYEEYGDELEDDDIDAFRALPVAESGGEAQTLDFSRPAATNEAQDVEVVKKEVAFSGETVQTLRPEDNEELAAHILELEGENTAYISSEEDDQPIDEEAILREILAEEASKFIAGPQTWAEALVVIEQEERKEEIEFAMASGSMKHSEEAMRILAGDDVDADPMSFLRKDHKLRNVQVQEDANSENDSFKNGFDPNTYLSKYCATLTYAELKSLEQKLSRALVNKTAQQKEIVSFHFDRFVNSKSRLDKLHESLQASGIVTPQNKGQSKPDEIFALLAHVRDQSQEIFGPMLARRRQADRIRNVIGILQRFQFLFNLPTSLQTGIMAGNFDRVVQDYKKARNLRLGSNSAVFVRINSEVNFIVKEFRSRLFKRLQDPRSNVEETEKLIRHLVELDAEKDPVMFCLSVRHEAITKLLADCNSLFQSGLRDVDSKFERGTSETGTLSKNPTDRRSVALSAKAARAWKRLSNVGVDTFNKTPSAADTRDEDEKLNRKTLDPTTGTNLHKITDEMKWLKNTAERAKDTQKLKVKLIQDMSLVLRNELPPFWRIAKSCLLGRYARDGEGFPLQRKRGIAQKILEMLNDIFGTYAVAARMTLLSDEATSMADLDGSDRIACIQVLREVVALLEIDSEFMIKLVEMVSDVTADFVQTLSDEVRSDIAVIHHSEDWNLATVQADDIHVGISGLPGLLQEFLEEYVEQLSAVLAPGHIAMSTAEAAFCDMFLTFADGQHALCFNEEWSHMKREQQAQDGSSTAASSREREMTTVSTVSTASANLLPSTAFLLPEEKRLLILMSNNRLIATSLLPKLSEKFSTALKVPQNSHTRIVEVYAQLFNMMEIKYVRCKVLRFNDIIKNGVALAGTDWANCGPPARVNTYILELLMELVLVHNEVSTVSPKLTSSILSSLYGEILRGLAFRMKQLNAMSTNGALQVELDVAFLCLCLKQVQHADTEALVNHLIRVVAGLANVAVEEIVSASRSAKRKKILERLTASTAKQFECLNAVPK